MDNLFVEQRHLDILTGIFDEYCPNATVYAYGSRVNGDAHEGSDLDLAIIGEDFSIIDIRQAINDSNIPFLIDIFDFKSLPEYFKTEILKKNVIIY